MNIFLRGKRMWSLEPHSLICYHGIVIIHGQVYSCMSFSQVTSIDCKFCTTLFAAKEEELEVWVSTVTLYRTTFQGAVEKRRDIVESYILEILIMTWRGLTAFQEATQK